MNLVIIVFMNVVGFNFMFVIGLCMFGEFRVVMKGEVGDCKIGDICFRLGF